MKTAVIPFEGVNLISGFDEKTGDRYVAVNPIIDYFGLDRRGQKRKLYRLAEEKGVDLKSLPLETKGGIQETLAINVNHLPAFLYSIQQSRVRPELREKLRKFQIQTTQVINDYWNNNYSTRELPEYVKIGKVYITPKRAEIIEKFTNFVKEVKHFNPIRATQMMNKLLKALGERPLSLPIPPEEYLPNENWLSTKEVAIYFGVTTEAVRKWIKQRKLYAIRYKGNYFISREEFIYFAKNKNKPMLPTGFKK